MSFDILHQFLGLWDNAQTNLVQNCIVFLEKFDISPILDFLKIHIKFDFSEKSSYNSKHTQKTNKRKKNSFVKICSVKG